MTANYWLRPRNIAASTNYLAFLESTLSRLENKTAELVRMESDFFTEKILDCLECKEMHYIVACRFNNHIKYSRTHELKTKTILLLSGNPVMRRSESRLFLKKRPEERSIRKIQVIRYLLHTLVCILQPENTLPDNSPENQFLHRISADRLR